MRCLLLLAASIVALGCGDSFTPGAGGDGGTSTSSDGGGGGAPADPIGCSDGSREYLQNPNQNPQIAGCQGAWREPGVTSPNAAVPRCDRRAGNDGDLPLGEDTGGVRCSVADLCSAGWHVCDNALEVSALLASCPAAAGTADLWITRQTTDANAQCPAGGGNGNNVVGCGSLGNPPMGTCAPLDRLLIFSLCNGTVWSCNDQDREGEIVEKLDPSQGGGVLCCAD